VISKIALAWPLAKRDVMARYRGSIAGVLWALLAPLAMVAIYALVFRGVFQARWGSGSSDGLDYVLRLFAGLMMFTATAEVATRATRLVQDNANLVKRVVFPLELLALALLLQVAVHSLLQIGLLAVLLLATGQGPLVSWLWLPLAWAWLLALQYALALLLAALGCYLRDLQHLVPVAMGGLMFLSPVFYPSSSAPGPLAVLLAINPLTMPIELARAGWFGDNFDGVAVVVQIGLLLVALIAAHWVFRRLRPGFADQV
jgi:lipopolysaccharide transport system permease protein